MHEELVEHFLLTPAERAIVDTCYGDVHRHGVAVLLKAVQYRMSLRSTKRPCRPFPCDKSQMTSYRSVPPVGPIMTMN
jgi:hypothetical protein